MNVSFTRARSKLIIFGSRKTLQAAPLLSEFFDLMDSQGWIISLPFQADKIHPLPLTSKRVARDMDDHESRKENLVPIASGQKKPRIHERLLNRRPMLRDVLNNEK
jgi:DNA replication ATP-dependent helicase Dna2